MRNPLIIKILAVDLSSGFIWGELNDQVTKWIHRINEHGITKWILYLSALDENTEPEKRGLVNVERIQRELNFHPSFTPYRANYYLRAADLNIVVMIQCVGSRNDEMRECSRICRQTR